MTLKEDTCMDPETFISKYEPRKMVAISLAVFAVAFAILGFTYINTGSPVRLGVEFTGGTIVTVPVIESEGELAAKLAGYPVLDLRDVGHRYMVQMGPMSDADYRQLSAMITSEYRDPEIKYMGPVYSARLIEQAKTYIPLSFLFMAVVIFLIFRTPFVAMTVIFAAFSDIVIAAACMTVVGVSLSMGTVAALLMLIGYSVDSNILLNMRVFKRKGKIEDKIAGAFRTGFAMTTTTLSAVVALFLVATFSYLVSPAFTQINILFDISIVLIFGITAGLMNTWVMNSNALRWYLARPKKAPARRQKR